jgi:hypothetical protein
VARKLVIEIAEAGRVQLLKRRNGVVKFLDRIDNAFKNKMEAAKPMEGIKMFFIEEEGGAIPVASGFEEPSAKIDLGEALDEPAAEDEGEKEDELGTGA